MLPLKDENPTHITPYATWSLLTINIVIFVWEVMGGVERFIYVTTTFGFVPLRVLIEGDYYTLLTSMFLHGGLLHLLGNMLYLYIFGDNVEDMCGSVVYLVFYLLCGVVASLMHMLTAWGSAIPTVGASGAISGILGAYVVLFPKVRIRTIIILGFIIRPILVPAYWLIGFWFIYQFLLALSAVETGIAYWAHVGGFVAGVVLIKPFARRKHLHPIHLV
ncbi:MAG: rhomboid family intramembrane serine protease [Candidatus Bathyarchaeia archaeon]